MRCDDSGTLFPPTPPSNSVRPSACVRYWRSCALAQTIFSPPPPLPLPPVRVSTPVQTPRPPIQRSPPTANDGRRRFDIVHTRTPTNHKRIEHTRARSRNSSSQQPRGGAGRRRQQRVQLYTDECITGMRKASWAVTVDVAAVAAAAAAAAAAPVWPVGINKLHSFLHKY